ncbi:uncharacterized protein LOC124435019 [Xenia sp. Carnegie-2017]|uniref:uncharacterized protein LOC124435019 n=1 Tax=Xenia sp. Carnegie-2017 TaxID=2897299 RepID=UPI001F047891|nr:uncharacterized protein LOC124435019 [Xenia sp. Carnegie-2017]XP_046840923.1 uncharacterized protein LOC124435019 [Xenia sp. Carnegie-2017]
MMRWVEICVKMSRPVRSDNCMQCRMEQSINDEENLPNIRDDPGFRQYPTFISPRKSLIMCKHHANETTAMDEVCVEYIQNEEMKSKYEILGNKTIEIIPQKNVCFENGNSNKSNGTEEIKIDFGKSEMDFGKCEGTEGIKMDFMKSEGTEGINMDLEKSKGTEGIKMDFGKSEMDFGKCEGTEEMKMDLQKSDTKEMMIGKDSKGSLSPLFALSRDKKFVSTDKPIVEDIKTAPSLEWDDIGTELSPPNVSDEDIDENGQKDEQNDMKKSSIKLMNTNEALDKLKVIQNLIMKEAESRSRKDSDENDVKHVNFSNETGKEVHMKHENEVEALSQTEESRRPLSPTIWDRITNNSTMSQHQTTELLNETLAKLKASPKFDESSFVKSTFNTRSLPRSTQTSKKQISIDGDKPVCVYTSNWIGTGSKNSRGSLQSLRSSHHSLPNSRHNLTSIKEPAIKQLENTAGHMDSKEQLESTKVMVASFEEINISDGLNVHKPKHDVMHKDKLPSNDDKAHKKSTKDSKIKVKIQPQ